MPDLNAEPAYRPEPAIQGPEHDDLEAVATSALSAMGQGVMVNYRADAPASPARGGRSARHGASHRDGVLDSSAETDAEAESEAEAETDASATRISGPLGRWASFLGRTALGTGRLAARGGRATASAGWRLALRYPRAAATVFLSAAILGGTWYTRPEKPTPQAQIGAASNAQGPTPPGPSKPGLADGATPASKRPAQSPDTNAAPSNEQLAQAKSAEEAPKSAVNEPSSPDPVASEPSTHGSRSPGETAPNASDLLADANAPGTVPAPLPSLGQAPNADGLPPVSDTRSGPEAIETVSANAPGEPSASAPAPAPDPMPVSSSPALTLASNPPLAAPAPAPMNASDDAKTNDDAKTSAGPKAELPAPVATPAEPPAPIATPAEPPAPAPAATPSEPPAPAPVAAASAAQLPGLPAGLPDLASPNRENVPPAPTTSAPASISTAAPPGPDPQPAGPSPPKDGGFNPGPTGSAPTEAVLPLPAQAPAADPLAGPLAPARPEVNATSAIDSLMADPAAPSAPSVPAPGPSPIEGAAPSTLDASSALPAASAPPAAAGTEPTPGGPLSQPADILRPGAPGAPGPAASAAPATAPELPNPLGPPDAPPSPASSSEHVAPEMSAMGPASAPSPETAAPAGPPGASTTTAAPAGPLAASTTTTASAEAAAGGWIRLPNRARALSGAADGFVAMGGATTLAPGSRRTPRGHADKNVDFEPQSFGAAAERRSARSTPRPTDFENEGADGRLPGTARANAGPPRADAVPHVVERNENFWTISRLYYSSGRYYRALWKANARKIPKIDALHVQDVIVVPPVEELDPAFIDPPGGRSERSRAVARDGPDDRPARTPNVREASARNPLPARRPPRTAAVLNLPSDETGRARIGSSDDFRRGSVGRGARGGTGRDDWPDFREAARPRSGSPVRLPAYKVRRYDTLRSIARDVLGDARRAEEILELNANLISDPARLVPGQILDLPEDADLRRVTSRDRD